MKALYLLLLTLLVSQCFSRSCSGTATSASECNNAEKVTGIYRCCYLEQKYTLAGQSVDTKTCYPVTEEQFKEIKTIVDATEAAAKAIGATGVSIDINCSSKYLVSSILTLLLFLF
jgi:hypothetical protein